MASEAKRGPRARRKYELVAADLIARIGANEWAVGEKIPPIDDLARAYPYARMTVFNAVQEVIRRGYLEVQRGVGTFVSARPNGRCLGLVFGEDVLHPQETPFPAMLCRELRQFFGRIGDSAKLYVEVGRGKAATLPEELTEAVAGHRLAGVITAAGEGTLLLPSSAPWRQAPVPHVDISVRDTVAHRVVFESGAVVHLGLQYCRLQQRRRVAVLGLSGAEARAAVAAQIAATGCETRPEWLPDTLHAGSLQERDGHFVMHQLWACADRPDAIIVTDDIAAKGVCQAILQLGLRIPEELALVTHYNRGSGVFYPFPLPLIEFDVGECARLAAELLLELIADPGLPPTVRCMRPVLRLPDGLLLAAGA